MTPLPQHNRAEPYTQHISYHEGCPNLEDDALKPPMAHPFFGTMEEIWRQYFSDDDEWVY